MKKTKGLEVGHYVIANVFGEESNLRPFLISLRSQGFEPSYFQRKVNGYYYAYLQRFDTFEQAAKMVNSQFNGRYDKDLWILEVN